MYGKWCTHRSGDGERELPIPSVVIHGLAQDEERVMAAVQSELSALVSGRYCILHVRIRRVRLIAIGRLHVAIDGQACERIQEQRAQLNRGY